MLRKYQLSYIIQAKMENKKLCIIFAAHSRNVNMH